MAALSDDEFANVGAGLSAPAAGPDRRLHPRGPMSDDEFGRLGASPDAPTSAGVIDFKQYASASVLSDPVERREMSTKIRSNAINLTKVNDMGTASPGS